MSQENKPLLDWFLIFSLFFLIVLIIFVASVVFGEEQCKALSCGSIPQETVVANSEEIWTHDHELIKLIEEAEITPETVKEIPTTKEAIVANVIRKEEKRENYTIRVGLQGSMKPIPKLSGDKDERARQLLDTVWIGHTLPIWKSLGEKYGIDYTLPIAIGFADSHLGKALKSKNNIGNIWNNDRGHTKEFDSLESWIEAIFWSLAKWKYMSGHNTIWTLSGEGRKRLWLPWCAEEKDYRKKCYASSMWVWSTNVVNIMSAMHNKEIREDYNFKI